jgi:predicted phage baseplate assembly protein
VTQHATPRFETRRHQQWRDELVGRARDWLSEWRPRIGNGDFAAALFEIAARLQSEVAQRLDKAADKNFRGFLDWLGVRGQPGRAARLPIVFQMTAGSDPVDAAAPVQFQASGGGQPIVFETVSDLRLIPGSLASLVAADPANDAFYLPPGSIFSQMPPPAMTSEWQLKASANVGDTRVQLDPQIGLDPGLILRDPANRQQYRVSAANAGIVTLDPAIAAAMPVMPGAPPPRLLRVDAFDGFGAGWLNAQGHAVFLGAANALNIATAAVIEIVNGAVTLADADWRYSGAPSAAEPSGWLPLQKVVSNGRLYLLKPAGAIASVPVEARPSRWLRATSQLAAGDSPAQAFGLRLLINCRPTEGWPPQVADYFNAPAPAKISLEGIANTAPLVLDAPFYPLGPEPRLFDAFYLGCQEAFSKPAARVTLSFTIDDSFGGPLAAIALAPDNLAVGVGLDAKLHRLHQSETGVGANRSPLVEFLAPVAPSSPDGQPIALTAGPRPGAASWRGTAYVTVAAGAEVWRWSQNQAGGDGVWASLDRPMQGSAAQDAVETILLRTSSDAGLRAYAAGAGNLYQRDAILAADWQPVPVLDQGQPVHVAKLAPVVRAAASPGELYEADGLACLDQQGRLFLRSPAGTWNRIALADSLDPAVYPLIVKDDAGRLLCFAGRAMPNSAPSTPIAFDLAQPDQTVTDNTVLVGNAVDFAVRHPNEVVAVFAGKPQDGSAGVAVWDAFGDGTLVLSAPPVGTSALAEPPLRVGDYRLFAEKKGDVGIATVDPGLMQTVVNAAVTDAALFTDNARDWSHEVNLLLDLTPTRAQKEVVAVTSVHRLAADSWAFELEHSRVPAESPVASTIYRALHADLRTGNRLTVRRVELADNDTDAQAGRQLYLTWDNRTRIIPIRAIEPPAAPSVRPIAVLERELPPTAATPQYKTVEAAGDHDVVLRPIVDCGGLRDTVRDALGQGFAEFPTLDPARQNVLQIIAADQRIILAAPWNRRPSAGGQFDFTAFAALSGWRNFALPRAQNPVLSWEYWDGTGWWQIPGLADDTSNLVTSGTVFFCVPANLQPTDVAGRTNNWIRARLVSGDYGQETVTIHTTGPDLHGDTTQQIIRSSDAIHPPYVVRLDLSYQLCCPVLPDVVLTRDNGGDRDQTAANNTAGAIVEHAVPLGVALSRLAGSTRTGAPPGQTAPLDCVDCNASQAGPVATAPAAAVTVTGNDGGRALYLGFDSKLEDGPISLLFLVVDSADDGAFPLRVEALTGSGFKPVAADDGTRGLSESGIISFNLAESPQLTSLFGVEHYWLRLRPNLASAAAGWQPQIRGAYLNAAWAKAAETQRLQILGSSDGSPNQTATLARPPVLANSLELRIFERLDDEEVAALLRQDPNAVKDPLGPWPGPWVLWHETTNLTDNPADARVYRLDDVSGVVTFGDGVNGKIPPTGTNVIVAVQYERVGDATANDITAWSQLNLVTPLQGAQGIFAPDGAAGGANSQDPADTLRFAPFNLSARGRALTVTDYEQLALQFAPEIAQARALPTRGGICLVVVTGGRDPIPSNAVQRELRLDLLDRSSPMMSVPGALVIAPPRPVAARLELALTVDAVKFSGAVSRDALSRINELIDPGSGGHDGTGWQLGDVPTDTDIAAALADVDHLQGIDRVSLYQINDDGSETPFPAALRADQLFRLAPDGVSIEFAYAQTEVVG